MDGYLKLFRKIQEHWLWQDRPFSKGQAWIDLLLMANHRETRFVLGNEVITAGAGDVITSEQKLMKRWGWSKSKVRAFLQLLEQDGMISKKADTKKTTLTLCNYRDYNDPGTAKRPPTNRAETTPGPRPDTINNYENYNNIKNYENTYSAQSPDGGCVLEKNKSAAFVPPTAEAVDEYCRERRNSVDAQAFVDFYASKGWVVGKAKMRDWRASVRSWERSAQSAPRARAPHGEAASYTPQKADIERLKRFMADMEIEN